MAIDLNDAPDQRPDGVIPDGTFVKLVAALRAGGVDGDTPDDRGLLRPSKSSDAVMLDFDFTVLYGPYRGRHVFRLATISGGSLDDEGRSRGGLVTKREIKAMIRSAFGIDPKDQSERAKIALILPSWSVLHGIEFAARLGVEAGTNGYPDKNTIAHIVEPGEPEYAAITRGEDVPPKPSRTVGTSRPARTADNPPWQTQAASAQAVQAAQPALWGAAAGTAPAAAPVATPSPAAGAKPAGPAWLNG